LHGRIKSGITIGTGDRHNLLSWHNLLHLSGIMAVSYLTTTDRSHSGILLAGV
jgi:hypothetical protein